MTIGDVPATPVSVGSLGLVPVTEIGGLFPQPLMPATPIDVLDFAGDMIYALSDNTPARLPIGSQGQFLTPVGVVPTWVSSVDTVVAAAARASSNKLAAGDAQPAYQILGDGTNQWGPGGSVAPDTLLYRGGVGQLWSNAAFRTQNDSGVLVFGSAAGTHGFRVYSNPADSQPRWEVLSDGSINLGPGGSTAADVKIVRSGAKSFQSDSALNLLTGASSQIALAASFAADASPYRFAISNDGILTWGAGGAARDCTLQRLQAGVLQTDSQTLVLRSTSGSTAYQHRVSGDTQSMFFSTIAGSLSWGSGGSTAVDTTLARVAAATLRVSNVLEAPSGAGTVQFGGASWNLQSWATAGDAQPAFNLNRLGAIQWGPGGAAAVDTSLTRSGVGAAQLAGSLTTTGGYTSSIPSVGVAIRALVSGDTQNRIQINADATPAIYIGTGSVAPSRVLGTRRTGWTAWTGTATRTTFATSTATLVNVAEAVKALIDDLIAHGIIGA